ncbi:MAG: hypothetical protein RI564_09775 [Gracilimonas sp.]|nr:hypothetical protein [Gracilimonas sp.]
MNSKIIYPCLGAQAGVQLYNLTWEEVKVVYPEFGLSEEEYEDFEVDVNQ